MNEQQHLRTFVNRQTDQAQNDYWMHLNDSIDCVQFLLRQGLAFRGHDESNNSINKDIQKDIVNACATETINIIIRDLGEALFSILVDEAHDVSAKEQMAIIIRYVEKNGHVLEHILGILHVTDTSALSLKAAIDALFSKHSLSISRLWAKAMMGQATCEMFSVVIDALEWIMENPKFEQKAEAFNLLDSLQSFDVAFSLHLMRNILRITYELSQALQRKNKDIVNAMTLVKIAKQQL
ncbi:uncharacterized protein LOC131178395 [Hevea brasiliensis]|uniref:uncharacterized protein LOC131178395 n=1 Tax=Hevea brasiliensis TaxID=3981 RepID=UPI0025D2F531|nr:uncharacterized protein LOC131178395 [Hevea brasiliensis]